MQATLRSSPLLIIQMQLTHRLYMVAGFLNLICTSPTTLQQAADPSSGWKICRSPQLRLLSDSSSVGQLTTWWRYWTSPTYRLYAGRFLC